MYNLFTDTKIFLRFNNCCRENNRSVENHYSTSHFPALRVKRPRERYFIQFTIHRQEDHEVLSLYQSVVCLEA